MSMYEFIDTTETPSANALPVEAMSVNGVYLENVIEGYTTLYTRGRETPDIDIGDMQIGNSDGVTELYRRYEARTITVGYKLTASTAEAFREAYNELNSYIKPQGLKLIFADEPDKYFIGTFDGASDVEAGTNSVTSELTLYCADPFKHAVTPKTFTAENVDGILTANIVNEGTVPVPITYNVTMNSDNGYIGIAGASGAMQYGFKAEADGETYTVSETLATLTNLINAADDHGTEAMHPASREGTAGTLGVNTSWVSGKKFLTLSAIGSDTKAWNGGMKTLTIPADSQGVTGAKNWYCYFHVFIWASLMGQTGTMTLSFLTADDVPICGVNWYKTDTSGNTGHYEIWAYDPSKAATETRNAYINVLKDWTYECNHLQTQNPWYWDWGHCDIRKSGSKVTFFWSGRNYTYDLAQIKDLECAKIQFSVKSAKGRTGNKALARMGLENLSFRKDNVEKWSDLPNRYSSGDTVEINGEEGKIYVNGMARMGDEITGTAYFKAEPGTNKVEIYNSDWAEDVTATATIREAWL